MPSESSRKQQGATAIKFSVSPVPVTKFPRKIAFGPVRLTFCKTL